MLNPFVVWEETWKLLADGILYDKRKRLKLPGRLKFIYTYTYALFLNSSNLCYAFLFINITVDDGTLKELWIFNGDYFREYDNILLFNELNFHVKEMLALFDQRIIQLNEDQKIVYDHIIQACSSQQGGLFFVYGYGGTRKTFLWKTFVATYPSVGGESRLTGASSKGGKRKESPLTFIWGKR